jgi:CO/xanthine dehydrogenase Mo-binding subunit
MNKHDDTCGITNRPLSRRQMLKGSGALIFSFSLSAAFARSETLAQDTTTPPSPIASPGAAPSPTNQTQQQVEVRNVGGDQVDSYLAIGKDGRVTLYSGKVELGTGTETALSQIVAEELNVTVDMIDVIMGDTHLTPDMGYTAGSKTIQTAGPVYRYAAGEANAVLLSRAADQLGVSKDQLTVKNGVVSVKGDNTKSVGYGDLIGEGFEHTLDIQDGKISKEVTGNEPIESPSEYTIVGTPVPRVDIPPKLTGKPIYIQDLRLDGMVHGRVVRPWLRTPTGVGATVKDVDESSVQDIPGLIKVVRDGNFIGVVADNEWSAIQAADKLKVTWDEGDPEPEQTNLYDYIRNLPVAKQEEVARVGDVDAALSGAAKTLKATYYQPFQAHASMGPSCSVADVRSDGATIYSSTQGVYPLRGAIAGLLGLKEEAVHIVYVEGAGCYGHNGFDDCSGDAAMLSKAVGKPVRVQWMRQDAFAYEPKGPAMIMDAQGALDEQGNVVAWDYVVRTATHSTRPGGQAGNLLAGQLKTPPAPTPDSRFVGGDRNAAHIYQFTNNRVTAHWLDMYILRPSALRSLGGWANTMAVEQFMDELAAAAKVDPIEFRLKYLKDQRAIDVVKKVAELSGWQSRPAGSGATSAGGSSVVSGRGFAFAQYESEFTYVAMVADVDVDRASGNVQVNKVSVAHDCGQIINPNGLKNQIEGNVIQGTSRALKEMITWEDHRLTSIDWETYPILTFPEVPEVDIALIDRVDQPPLGAGEPTICLVPAAIGNAIFDATGARVRSVPYRPETVKAALG